MALSLREQIQTFEHHHWHWQIRKSSVLELHWQQFQTEGWKDLLQSHRRGKKNCWKIDSQNTLFVKVYRRGGLLGKWGSAYLLDSQRAFGELECYLFLEKEGFYCPRPLGAALWQGKVFSFQFLFLEWWPSALPPCQFWHTLSLSERRQHLREIASTVRKLHQLGVYHADLNVTNLLYQPATSRWSVVDLDRAQIFPSPLEEDMCWKNLLRLYRSAEKLAFCGQLPRLSLADYHSFLKAYWQKNCLREGIERARRARRFWWLRKLFWRPKT